MKIVKSICLLYASVALLTGCQGDLMDLSPYDSIASGNMWTTGESCRYGRYWYI